MKMQKSTRADRVEQVLRWMLAFALIAAVAWAWAQGGAGIGLTDPFAG
ncbi:hypothetical protein ACFOLC_00720 [Lysobacter cavernae]|uniref:Uncharacterized protein n=1 Tax=Lysobacter cavernae TaxID=1685901 RepID=A0ABV7RKZ8_9GAMM